MEAAGGGCVVGDDWMTASGSEAAPTRLTAAAPSSEAPAALEEVLRLSCVVPSVRGRVRRQRPAGLHAEALAPGERPVSAVCRLVSATQKSRSAST